LIEVLICCDHLKNGDDINDRVVILKRFSDNEASNDEVTWHGSGGHEIRRHCR